MCVRGWVEKMVMEVMGDGCHGSYGEVVGESSTQTSRTTTSWLLQRASARVHGL